MKRDYEREKSLAQAKARKAAEMELRKKVARRAYGGGQLGIRGIATIARVDDKTVKAWASEGNWKRGDE